MTKFDLCCELPCEEGMYAVPSLFPACTEEAAWVESDADMEACIRFIHEDGDWDEARGFLPQSLFFSLQVGLLKFATDSKEAMNHLYDDRICFFGDQCFMLRLSPTDCRMHLTVQASTDGGQTWGNPQLVQAGPSAGYSCLVKGAVGPPGARRGGVLYEGPAGGQLSFATFAL